MDSIAQITDDAPTQSQVQILRDHFHRGMLTVHATSLIEETRRQLASPLWDPERIQV